MKYSIIVPVYNAEKTLERCVESIVKQSFTDYEIILVNDGSKDNSKSICAKLSDEYSNVVLVDKKNGGASSARNAGIDIASGKYILFVDSDDYLNDDFFEVIDSIEKDFDLAVFTYS